MMDGWMNAGRIGGWVEERERKHARIELVKPDA
jgi:hypothetical protein